MKERNTECFFYFLYFEKNKINQYATNFIQKQRKCFISSYSTPPLRNPLGIFCGWKLRLQCILLSKQKGALLVFNRVWVSIYLHFTKIENWIWSVFHPQISNVMPCCHTFPCVCLNAVRLESTPSCTFFALKLLSTSI